MTLELPTPVRESIFEHARSGDPAEVVGMLAGHRGDTSTVKREFRAENAADAPKTRYEIAPETELELLERIDEAGLDVVGFYHSHPRGPLEPSAVDAKLAAWPGYSYVIVSLAEGSSTLGSWRWDGQQFERETVRRG
jgi:proteasome lid subunit RPN8/RPN11